MKTNILKKEVPFVVVMSSVLIELILFGMISNILEGRYLVAMWQFNYCMIYALWAFGMVHQQDTFKKYLAGMKDSFKLRRLQCAIAPNGASWVEIENHKGQTRGILCLKCGYASWNENDVKNLYCGWCHEYHIVAKPRHG